MQAAQGLVSSVIVSTLGGLDSAIHIPFQWVLLVLA